MKAALDISDAVEAQQFTDELKPGTTLLRGQYSIERFLNYGGFGLTYLARDSLDRTVVIKECFPTTLCARSDQIVRARSRSHQDEFRSVVRLFVQEARRLAKVRHPNIVGVHQVFEDNETAYMALDYVDGQDLLDIIEDDRQSLTPHQVQDILRQLLQAIGFVHDNRLLHRDISPDNILLDKRGMPVLIDFGAARERATRVSRALSALQVVKDGYSPQEFYIAGVSQGPASDLYALGATFHHLISGEIPPNSQLRLSAIAANEPDPYQPLAGRIRGYPAEFLTSIDKAMQVFPKDRYETAQDWLKEIDIEARREAALARAEWSAKTERMISELVAETNKVVLQTGPQRERGLAQAQARAPEPVAQVKKEKKIFFSWQLEDDWLIGQADGEDDSEQEDEAEAGGHSNGHAAEPAAVSGEAHAYCNGSEPPPGSGERSRGFLGILANILR
jgi:serine/threonine protein kinase